MIQAVCASSRTFPLNPVSDVPQHPTFRELWEDCALFASPADPAAAAAAIDRLAEDVDLRTQLGAAARERALGYSIERQAASLASIYRTLTVSPRPDLQIQCA